MTWLVLTNSSPGATRNAGVNGDLCTLLDWALPQAGWAIEYTGTNSRVYRPGSGNRFRLHVQHDSAVSGVAGLAVVRGCEDASNSTTLIDPFPLVAQIANNSSNWLISNTANTTDRPFRIYLSETFIFYFSQASSTADNWDYGFFGDCPTNYDSDNWNTICMVRNSTSASVGPGMQQTTSTTAVGTSGNFWARDITGATKSSRGILYASGSALCNVSGTAPVRGGYQNRVYREYIGVTDYASASLAASVLSLIKRGWLPNAWNPLHTGRGSVSDVDTFTDTVYNPAASFRLLSSIIMEETDTWSPP